MFSFTNFAFTASLWVAIMYAIITSNKTLDFWQPMGSFTVVLGLLVCVSGSTLFVEYRSWTARTRRENIHQIFIQLVGYGRYPNWRKLLVEAVDLQDLVLGAGVSYQDWEPYVHELKAIHAAFVSLIDLRKKVPVCGVEEEQNISTDAEIFIVRLIEFMQTFPESAETERFFVFATECCPLTSTKTVPRPYPTRVFALATKSDLPA